VIHRRSSRVAHCGLHHPAVPVAVRLILDEH
jgi:hypothetical protein